MITILFGILFLIILISITWNTIYFGIGPTPTSPKVKLQLLKLLPEHFEGTIYELGAGFGTLAFALAKKYPKARILAIEGSLFPFLTLKVIHYFYFFPNLFLLKKNFLNMPLQSRSILICYLAPAIMKKIADKLRNENYTGELYTHTFSLPQYEPQKIVQVNDLYKTPIFIYRI